MNISYPENELKITFNHPKNGIMQAYAIIKLNTCYKAVYQGNTILIPFENIIEISESGIKNYAKQF